MIYSYLQAFQSKTEFEQYGANGHLLYTLGLRERIEDIHSVAATSLTDGNNDKKADLVYIDEEKGLAVVAQGYYSIRPRQSAPANKASDLNIAAAWLLGREIEDLPEQLKSKATELREALGNGTIHRLEFWYVHNLEESKNVEDEMTTVEHTAKEFIGRYVPEGGTPIDILGLEVGNNKIEEWYLDSEATISVTKEYTLDVVNGFKIETSEWDAFVTFISGKWLYDLYHEHERKLFSANIRDYLGHRRSDKNINFGITQTAQFNSSNFWVFNNGITALVNKFEQLSEDESKLLVEGISIVNGAQTTGALGQLASPPSEDLLIPIRFVVCKTTAIVKKIIEYNNKQNKIEATDFRSNDAVQRRLRSEFDKLEGVYYDGGRRTDGSMSQGGYDYLPSYTVAQSLTAFYGNPINAGNSKSEIWSNNSLYERVFNDGTNSENIIFVYSLFRAIEKIKLDLSYKETLSEREKEHLQFLRYRKSFFLLCYAISTVLEEILDRPIPAKTSLKFRREMKPSEAIDLWCPVVRMAMNFSKPLISVMETGVKNMDNVNLGVEQFKAAFSSFLDITRDGVAAFAEEVQA